jgi:DNA-binding NarL/FixJ family response regulator
MPIAKMLTTREYKVLRLVAQGKRNKEIALNLRISENTVEQHLKTIYKKLGVRNRTEAINQIYPVDPKNNGNP